MAYVDGRYEVMVVKDGAIDTSGDLGDWAPGIHPHIIRAVAVIVTTATTVAATVVGIDKRVTAGSDTGRVVLDTITVPVSIAAGKVIYLANLDFEVLPGEEIVIDTDGGSTAGDGHVVLLVEPRWEQPGNNTDMTASA